MLFRSAMQQILLAQVPALSERNFLNEPMPRGTASVIGYAAMMLRRKSEDAVMACLTADHIIENEAQFLEILAAAESRALEGELVTLGISPSTPSTGYGYIHFGEDVASVGGFKVKTVQQFKEKPDRKTAVAYLDSGEYAWNSGMFVWTASRILEEIERQMPALYEGLEEIQRFVGTAEENDQFLTALRDAIE